MTALLDPRSLKALQVAAGASNWVRLVGKAFAIPSQSDARQVYVASADTCDCEDSRRNPQRLCKHSIACAVVLALIDSQGPVPATTALVATREDDDVVGWDKPKLRPLIAKAGLVVGS